jgi:hypothetical protein
MTFPQNQNWQEKNIESAEQVRALMRLAADGSIVPEIIPKHYRQFNVDFLLWGKL